MSFPELLEAARNLTRVEKIQLLHELLDEVVAPNAPELLSHLPPGSAIISPIPAPAAAAVLADLLAKGDLS